MEHDNYLPFGTRWNDGSPTDPDNRYRFNGKESQKFAGLPYIDYGARMYDPCTARWLSQDPLAEKYCSVSPYAFCSNNPVNFAIKREQNELAHFAEREQRKARRGLTLLIRMERHGTLAGRQVCSFQI